MEHRRYAALAAPAAERGGATAPNGGSDPAQRRNTIRNATLRYPALTGSALADDAPASLSDASHHSDRGSSHVCAGSLVSIAAGICDEHKQDVLDSTLFAQFAASGQYDRDSQPTQWYLAYVSVLKVLGWNTSGFPFQKVAGLPQSFKLYSEIEAMSSKLWPQSARASLSATMKTLKSLRSSDRRIQVLGQSAATASAGNFQLGAVQESKDDEVTMQTMGVFFDSQGITSNFLFESYTGAATTLFAGAQTMVLDDGVYSGVRDEVQSKLKDQAQQFIVSIPI
jgi:hypothetical protein